MRGWLGHKIQTKFILIHLMCMMLCYYNTILSYFNTSHKKKKKKHSNVWKYFIFESSFAI